MARLSHRWFLVAGLLSCACAPQIPPATGHGSGGQGTGGAGTGGMTSVPTGTGGSSATGGASSSGGAGVGTGVGSGGATAGPDGGAPDLGRDTTTTVDPGTDGDGDFTVGPTYTKSADLTSKGAPAGRSFHFTMSSTDSKIFTGLDSTLLAANQHSFTRGVDVYIPAKYRDGTAAPFMVMQDGPDQLGNVRLALDNLTQETNPARRLPAFIAIAVANGGGDAPGSERGLEYDTMADRYARFIDGEVVPAVLADAAIKAAYPNLALTTDPDGRAAMGCSSGGAASLTMGWFRPDLFHRIVTYSGTFVALQDSDAPERIMYPLGAWDYHSDLSLIANADPKPLRIFINANQMDNGAGTAESGHRNWVLANQFTAAALKAKNYHYRYVFGMSAGHCEGKVRDTTLPDTLLWVWRGYPID